MALELRPDWCLSDSIVNETLTFSEWKDRAGKVISGEKATGWKPGEIITLTRVVERKVKRPQLAKAFGLSDSLMVGLAARWTCSATSNAGVHVGGPTPLDLGPETVLTLDVPVDVAHRLDVETCLVVVRVKGRQPGRLPVGSVLWSDSWDDSKAHRSVLLEGDVARVVVRSVSFRERFEGEVSSALWAIDLDPIVSFDDVYVNVVSVLINADIAGKTKSFVGDDGEPDLRRLPGWVIASMQAGIIRSLTGLLIDELAEETWMNASDVMGYEEGSIARILGLELIGIFGSLAGAVNAFRNDGPLFERRLQSRFAPNDWGR